MTNRKYRNEFQQYYAKGVIESNCNEITFINKGTETANINGFPLTQNQSISLDGKEGEFDVSNYELTFGSGGGSQSLWAIRKIYIK